MGRLRVRMGSGRGWLERSAADVGVDGHGGGLPCSTASTVRSRPPARQSPPAQTPGRLVRPSCRRRCARLAAPGPRSASTGLPSFWPMALNTMSAAMNSVSPVGCSRPLTSAWRANVTPLAWPSWPLHLDGRQPVVDRHAIGLRPVLLVARGRHRFRPAPVDHVHALGAQQPALHGRIDRRHAAADHHHAAADGQVRLGPRLAQLGDEVDRVSHAGQVFARHAQLLTCWPGPRRGTRRRSRWRSVVELGDRFELPAGAAPRCRRWPAATATSRCAKSPASCRRPGRIRSARRPWRGHRTPPRRGRAAPARARRPARPGRRRRRRPGARWTRRG